MHGNGEERFSTLVAINPTGLEGLKGAEMFEQVQKPQHRIMVSENWTEQQAKSRQPFQTMEEP